MSTLSPVLEWLQRHLGTHQHTDACVPSPGLIHGPATVYRFGKKPIDVPRGYTYFPDCYFEGVGDPE